MERLAEADVQKALGSLPGWKLDEGKLCRDFQFRDFPAVMTYVSQLATLAEAKKHHPDFTVHSWNKLRVVIFTHDVGGLTALDTDLAAGIEALPRPGQTS